MSFHTFLGEFSVLFLKKNFFWSHYLHIFFLIHYLYFHIDLYYCKLIWFLCIFWMLRWWNVLQIYFSNLRFVVLWYFLLYRSVFLKIIVKFTAFVISTFFLFLFPFKVKICCPKARRPFTLYSLFRCSLFVYNVLSFLTQERFPNYYLHPFLSPKYKPSDLGILKRYYSFLK